MAVTPVFRILWRAYAVAQGVKVPSDKPDLGSLPGTYLAEGENQFLKIIRNKEAYLWCFHYKKITYKEISTPRQKIPKSPQHSSPVPLAESKKWPPPYSYFPDL